jgi:signal transduction histidine kinase/DNA-binding response OmpR family regulator
MTLRTKLLIPTLLFAALLIGIVGYTFVSNYSAFLEQAQQQTEQHRTNTVEIFNSRVRQTRSFIKLINQNELAVDSVVAELQTNAFSVITPYIQQTELSFISIYNVKGEIFVQTETPAVFGNVDDLAPLIAPALKTTESFSTVAFHHNTLTLLSIQRMDGVSGPTGVTVTGYRLDDQFVTEIATRTSSHVAVFYDNQMVTSSLPDAGKLAAFDQVPVTFSEVQPAKPFKVVLLQDNTPSLQRFRRDLGITLAVLVVASSFAVGLLLVINSSITQRIRQSLALLRRVEMGDLQARLEPPFLRDELGKLQVGINATARQLEENFNTLEQRVVQRTSELAMARDEALEATRAKSVFLANMSHELRTPLNAILGYSEMLQEEAADLGQEEFIPDLQKIHGAGKHLLALINDILDLSKIEAGRMDLFLEAFDIAPMIRDVVTTVKPLVEKNANTLAVHQASDLGAMRADLTKVRQALFNLLSNACKFTTQGTITLEVVRDPGDGAAWLTFRVIDTGIGLTPAQMGRLFQAFSQADSTTTRQYGGTGLGLAITQHFCHMMGGDITVESALGQGSTFTIRLPAEVIDPKAAPVLRAAAATASAVPEGAPTALVIDDDPTVHDLMQRFLSKEGLHMRAATSGAEGLRLAHTLRPAVITLDVLMPGMDGWTVLTGLKSAPDLADIPVIMLTIMDDKGMGYTLGAADYLTKPIDWERLAAILRKYPCAHPPCAVLIVEDNAAMRAMLRRELEKEGWVVTEAANGREALECVAANRPELILLDLMMPEMDGFAFVEELRQYEAWRSIPIVVLTAKDLTPDDCQRLNGYVEQILQKGAYSWEELLREVRDLVTARVR